MPVIVERFQSLHNFFHLLSWGNEVRNSEVVCARRLPETTSRHCHNTSLVHHIHAIEEVGFFTRRLSFIEELLGEVNFWETVHSSLNLGARNISHFIKSCGQQLGFSSECEMKRAILLQVLSDCVDRFNTKHGRVDHQFNCGLTDGIAAELD
jgi:hypothetical protein